LNKFPHLPTFFYRSVKILLLNRIEPSIFYRAVKIGAITMSKEDVHYGPVTTAGELGKVAREHRKYRKLTLEKISGLANVSTRFLSEFERGKETAEIGKIIQALRTMGLEIVIQPRTGIKRNTKTIAQHEVSHD
jgi:HTH-type transcriptional regulator / antitoxin HipB